MMLGTMVSCGVPLAEREPDRPEKAPLQLLVLMRRTRAFGDETVRFL
jgi:hypothetical protein